MIRARPTNIFNLNKTLFSNPSKAKHGNLSPKAAADQMPKIRENTNEFLGRNISE